MKPRLLFLFLLFSVTATAQISILTPIADSILYNVQNYLPIGGLQRQNDITYAIFYKNRLDTSYKMKQLFLDSSMSKKVSKMFYHNGKPNGPYEAYDMDKIQAKGNYKEGVLDGQRLTYFNSGTVMERAQFVNGKRSGIWEYYNFQGGLRRRITYNILGQILLDQQFK